MDRPRRTGRGGGGGGRRKEAFQKKRKNETWARTLVTSLYEAATGGEGEGKNASGEREKVGHFSFSIDPAIADGLKRRGKLRGGKGS